MFRRFIVWGGKAPRLFAAFLCSESEQHLETHANKVSSVSCENSAKTKPEREPICGALLDLRVFVYCSQWCVDVQFSTKLGQWRALAKLLLRDTRIAPLFCCPSQLSAGKTALQFPHCTIPKLNCFEVRVKLSRQSKNTQINSH